MRYASVCSGVEAASLAWGKLGWTPVFFAEVEPFPCAVLQQRFNATKPLHPLDPSEATDEKDRKMRESWMKQINKLPDTGTIPNLGDFTKIKGEDYVGAIDLLVGGTPCQDLSVAGKRAGFEGARSSLALDFVRLAYEARCQYFVWENVPGVFSSNRGRDFATLLSMFCGYTVDVPKDGWKSSGIVQNRRPDRYGLAWRVLDAQFTRVSGFPFAVPQRRRRVFLVGCFGDWERAASILLEPDRLSWDTPPRIKTREVLAGGAGDCTASAIRMRAGCDGEIACALAAEPGMKQQNYLCYDNQTYARNPQDTGNICGTLEAHMGTGGNTVPLVQNVSPALDSSMFVKNQTQDAAKYAAVMSAECFPLDLCNGTRDPEKKDAVNRQGCGVGNNGEPMGTLSTAFVPGVGYQKTVRRLLPIECERLMGFPDNHTRISWNGKPEEECPDAPRYKACGNSFCCNVMEWVGRRIEQYL